MAESIMLDKAKDFAVDIISICKSIKQAKKESVLTNQLLRSGTSVGAKIRRMLISSINTVKDSSGI